MPDLDFRVERVESVAFAAAPTLSFALHIANTPRDEAIHTGLLRCQIQIEVTRRAYSSPEQRRLHDLFGEPERWSRTLRNLHWTVAHATLPAFTGETVVDLQIPCTFDFNVAVTKYFDALEAGDIPLCLMFSGTIFYYANDAEPAQVSPIPWSKETHFRLPVRVWKEMMDAHYPNTAWLCVRRDVMQRLNQFKSRNSILDYDQALERALDAAQQTVIKETVLK
jgi:Family of unknown function (DUF6084)